MACDVIIMSSNGEDRILSFTIDNKENLGKGIEEALKKKGKAELESIITRLRHTNDRIDKDIELSRILDRLSNDYEIIGEYNHNSIKNYYSNSDYGNYIEEKLNYLRDKGVPVRIIVTASKGFKYGGYRSHGTVATTKNKTKIIYVNIEPGQDPDIVARDINHELSHAVYDDLIYNNYGDLQPKLRSLYNALAPHIDKAGTKPRIKAIGEKLKTYDKIYEIYSWIFSDAEMHKFASSIKGDVSRLIDEINDILPPISANELIPLSEEDEPIADNIYERYFNEVAGNYVPPLFDPLDGNTRPETPFRPLDSDRDVVPFSVEAKDLFVEGSMAAEVSAAYEKFKKDGSKDAWKKRNAALYDALMTPYKAIVDSGYFNLSYGLSQGVQEQYELYKIPKGSIIQVGLDASLTMGKWKERMRKDELMHFFGEKYNEIPDDQWMNVSLRKLHEYFNRVENLDSEGNQKTKPKSDLNGMIYKEYGKGKNKKKAWELVKNYPLAYIGKDQNGNPYAAVPKLYGKSEKTGIKSITKLYLDDIVSYREYSGKLPNIEKIAEGSAENLPYFQKFIEEVGVTPKLHVKGETSLQDETTDFIKNVLIKKKDGSTFGMEVIQDGNIKATGGMGSLTTLAKKAQHGSFVKFPAGWDKEGNMIMTYGMVTVNGAGGMQVLYYEKGNEEPQYMVISHSSITELFLPQYANNELLGKLTDEAIMNTTKDNFAETMRSYYDKNDKSKFIMNFGEIEKKGDPEDSKKTPEEKLKSKILMIRKATQGSVVKYVIPDGDTVKELVGTFITSDDEHAYVLPRYGNKVIRIPIKNKCGYYDKGLKKRVGYEFGTDPYEKKAALDTIFADITDVEAYLKHFDLMKKLLKDNKVLLDSYGEIDRDDEETALKMAFAAGKLDETEYLKAKRRLGIDKNSTQLDDELEIVNLVKFDNKKESYIDDDIEHLMDDHQKKKEIAQLRKGDLILYYRKNKDGKMFQRWEIVVDFDEKTKLPIIAHRQTNGRINPRVVNIENIKSIGLQLNSATIDGVVIEGRQALVEYRQKVLDNYLNNRQILMTKEKADEVVNAKNSRYGSKSRLRYKAVPVQWDAVNNRFSFKTLTGEANHPSNKEQMYKIIKQFYKEDKKSWEDGPVALKLYQIVGNETYNPGEFSFDQLVKGVKYGTIMNIRQQMSNGKIKYYDFFVEQAHDGKIKGKIMYEKINEKGEIVHQFFPKEIYKNSAVSTEVSEMYNADWKVLKDEKRDENRKGKSISNIRVIKKSEYLDMFKKSRDNKNTIKSAANRINSLYGINVNVLTDEEMNELGDQLSIDLSTARGLAHNNEIYINGDTASTAEALHEMGHLIFPGLKSMNPQLWNIIKNKVIQHPAYNIVAEKYSTLSEEDLAEETFMTIFGEFYRNVLMDSDSFDWYSENQNDFNEFVKNTSTVTGDIFEMDGIKEISDLDLMKMSLDEIMIQFGNAMLNGSLNVYFKQSQIITANSQMQKLYEKLLDSGNIETLC